MNTTPEPENTITQGEGMKSRTEVLELLAKEMEVLDMTEGAIASDEVWGGEKVAQLNAEDRAKNAKDSGHTLLTYLSHFNHLPYTDIVALGKLKTSLLKDRRRFNDQSCNVA